MTQKPCKVHRKKAQTSIFGNSTQLFFRKNPANNAESAAGWYPEIPPGGSYRKAAERAPGDQLENLGGFTGFPAKALGPGSDREKYILAALVVPKS